MATMVNLSAPSGVVVQPPQLKHQDWRSCSANAVRLVANAGSRQWCSSPSSSGRRVFGVRCEGGQRVGFLGRLGRVIKEKAKSDIQLLFSGFSKTRENLAVVDELLTYWNLDESESILDELEEVRSLRIYCEFSSLVEFYMAQFLSSWITWLSFSIKCCIRGRHRELPNLVSCLLILMASPHARKWLTKQ